MSCLKGYKQTKEHSEKIRLANLGKRRTKEFKEKVRAGVNKAIKEGRKTTWNKGLKGYGADVERTKEWGDKISQAKRGKPNPYLRGDKHHNWKGGISLIKRDLRSADYVCWRSLVFERDKYTCCLCGKIGGDLESHHVKTWKNEPTLRFELSNGVTLCRKCHNKTKGKEIKFELFFVEYIKLINYTRS